MHLFNGGMFETTKQIVTDTEGQILMKKKDNYARRSLVYLNDNQQLGDEMSL